jgi:hypothetical protein
MLDELATEFKEIDIPFQELDMRFDPVVLEDYQPVELEFTPLNTKVDWTEVRRHYLTHPTSSYLDLSKKFDVSLKQVKKHGSRDSWVESRQRVSDLTASKVEENLADERIAANERHIEGYQQAQALAIAYLEILAAQTEAAEQKAEAEGRLPTTKELPNPAKLLALTKALTVAINGERVCLGLPTAIAPAPVGWKPPEPNPYEGMSLEDILTQIKGT